jgi:hypothetical protein
MQLKEPIRLRPHHIDFLSFWIYVISSKNPIYEHPERLLDSAGINTDFNLEMLRYLSKNRGMAVQIETGPDFICQNCPGYDSVRNVCNRHYPGEDITISPENLRIEYDKQAMLKRDLSKIRTIEDILQRRHWKTAAC